MSLLVARASLRQVSLRQGARFAHTTEYKHLPFEIGSKAGFAVKLGSYLIVGFSIPFIAAAFQMRKSAGAS